VGVDVVDHGYPFELVLRELPAADDWLMAFRPDVVVASPPCEAFARHHLRWIKGPEPVEAVGLLRWAVGLVDRLPVPVLVECSRFAARHVRGASVVGSYCLWGAVPALLPDVPRRKARKSGRDPAARAMIEPALSSWVFDVLGRGVGCA
jgi:hypothetical protein